MTFLKKFLKIQQQTPSDIPHALVSRFSQIHAPRIEKPKNPELVCKGNLNPKYFHGLCLFSVFQLFHVNGDVRK